MMTDYTACHTNTQSTQPITQLPKRHNTHTVVIGLGVSGLSAVNYLHAHNIPVTVVDMHIPKLADKLPKDTKTHFGDICADILLTAELIVISPGVNPNHDSITKARQAGIDIVSDVQLFIDECHAKNIDIVAITGSNAKSTVTTLVGQMFKDAGQKVGVGGNLGVPALDLLQDDIDVAVLELSSFQLEGIDNLSAKVATILNLSADHLDRHGDMHTYLAQKLKIFDNATTAIINADDKYLQNACVNYIKQNKHTDLIFVSQDNYNTAQNQDTAAADFYITQNNTQNNAKQNNSTNQLVLTYQDKPLLTHDTLKIKGKHNLVNALFALAIGRACQLDMTNMIATLQDFAGLDHRCQFVKTVGNKDYFNDSKGTNVGATIAAINGLGQVYGDNSLAVILGGQAKGQDFGELVPLLAQYADSIYLIGEDTPKIRSDLTNFGLLTFDVVVIDSTTLQNAIDQAKNSTAKAVLLSPACASFDQFTGFANRGQIFVDLVCGL